MALRLTVWMLAATLCGCTFSRTVTNGYVRQLDTSWIEPGRTTRDEIVERLGYPPAIVGFKREIAMQGGAMALLIGSVGGAPAIGVKAEGESEGAARAFRWSCGDSNAKVFDGGWLVYPTFARQHQLRGHDIYILFDENDVVKLLSRTEVRDGRVRVLEWKELPR